MQNSTVISRVNAGLSRCLSHHRKLCRGIAELDCLIYNDEFLKDPRTQWLLHQRRQKEAELAKKEEEKKAAHLGQMRSEMRRLLGQSKIALTSPTGKANLSVTRAFCQLLQGESSSGSRTPKSRTFTGPLPAPTPLPSPERRQSLRVSTSIPRPEKKFYVKFCQSS
ncbi:uncharacterized protein LOC108088576 [Drosophila ficusphila]|uniref:uncharacterized protein LOC108088576 n=1 Tax=Drosophila ficusphila TaxID=30025 RepID=UPI0007E81A00|nr:uncharacterized protein LOC108088576 [Drosophila ficusphila]XP_017041915.1 uncharacterized protein LOC108088576 [Drosophila ficusphila]